MTLLTQALRAAHAPAPIAAADVRRPRFAVVVGAGGTLGSSVLEQALGSGGFARVHALVTQPIAPAVRGFGTLMLGSLGAAGVAGAADPRLDTAIIVFDRQRHANGREAAFLHPLPEQLLMLAQALRAAGVRHLVVVLPHAPALLPHAFKQGLATLDEQAVAALDFDHTVFVRSAQHAAQPGGGWPQRLAHTWLAQLALMVPQRDQPVRAAKVAAFVVHLALGLPASAPGARVVPPEVVWEAAQAADPQDVVSRWLDPARARQTAPGPVA